MVSKTGWKHLKIDRIAVPLIFLVGYALMSLVVWEQARTIALQQDALHAFYQDSLDLTALRLHNAAANKR